MILSHSHAQFPSPKFENVETSFPSFKSLQIASYPHCSPHLPGFEAKNYMNPHSAKTKHQKLHQKKLTKIYQNQFSLHLTSHFPWFTRESHGPLAVPRLGLGGVRELTQVTSQVAAKVRPEGFGFHQLPGAQGHHGSLMCN